MPPPLLPARGAARGRPGERGIPAWGSRRCSPSLPPLVVLAVSLRQRRGRWRQRERRPVSRRSRALALERVLAEPGAPDEDDRRPSGWSPALRAVGFDAASAARRGGAARAAAGPSLRAARREGAAPDAAGRRDRRCAGSRACSAGRPARVAVALLLVARCRGGAGAGAAGVSLYAAGALSTRPSRRFHARIATSPGDPGALVRPRRLALPAGSGRRGDGGVAHGAPARPAQRHRSGARCSDAAARPRQRARGAACRPCAPRSCSSPLALVAWWAGWLAFQQRGAVVAAPLAARAREPARHRRDSWCTRGTRGSVALAISRHAAARRRRTARPSRSAARRRARVVVEPGRSRAGSWCRARARSWAGSRASASRQSGSRLSA